jgi:hypothetical protein
MKLMEAGHRLPAVEAELAKVTAERDALADLAFDAVAGLRCIRQSHGELYGVGFDRVESKAAKLERHLGAARAAAQEGK